MFRIEEKATAVVAAPGLVRLFGLGVLLGLVSSVDAQTFNILGTSKWVKTDISISRGVVLQLDATGQVNYGVGEGLFGPDGTESFSERAGYLVDGPRRQGLIARITATDSPEDTFHVDLPYGEGNNELSIPSDAPFTQGRLWLGVNDYDASDNTGEYSVKVSVRLLSENEPVSKLGALDSAATQFASANNMAATQSQRGVYRITIPGFTCNTETWDHAFEVDGKRDEVLFLTEVRMISSNGNTLLASHPMSRVMGDTNHRDWQPPNSGYRIRAGSASRLGGIRTGDRFPSSSPWRRTSGISPDRPTMLVFEGELVQSQNGIVLAPTIWEYDGSPLFLQGWWTAIEDNGAAIAGAVQRIIQGGAGNGNYLQDALAVGLPAAGNLVRQIFGSAGDRMIGLNEKKREGNTISYQGKPQAIVLNYELAELATRNNFGKGPGVLEIQYRDHADIGGGWYTLYVQIERLR